MADLDEPQRALGAPVKRALFEEIARDRRRQNFLAAIDRLEDLHADIDGCALTEWAETLASALALLRAGAP